MKIQLSWALLGAALTISTHTTAFVVTEKRQVRFSSPGRTMAWVSSAVQETSSRVTEDTTTSREDDHMSLTNDIISKLLFREAQQELQRRELDASGTLTAMRDRLRRVSNPMGELSLPDKDGSEHDAVHEMNVPALNDAFAKRGISFQDTSDPDFDFNDLVRETMAWSERGHWKGATRKLKRLDRLFGRKAASNPRSIPKEVYTATLEACVADRLHGARAAEPARRIMEAMAEAGYPISAETANYCIKNCLGAGPNGQHDTHGGIDTALAMLAAVDASEQPPIIQMDTYQTVISTMVAKGELEYALKLLRSVVVEKSLTPTLELFADIATACVANSSNNNKKAAAAASATAAAAGGTGRRDDAERVLTLLAYAKAAGYELDTIASTSSGRELIAAGVIAAGMLDNLALGLRLFTAAGKAKGCAPDRGDTMIALSSSAVQRAATILHRRAINHAVESKSWKLAVKLLELMMERALTPSPSVWRNVVTCCAKEEKSRKATALLLDWVKLSQTGKAEKPPIRVFNTVMNACEIVGEEDLTVRVLETLKETHETEGNLITFNIALKRLAKLGNEPACEGIIIGMLQNSVEPSVVSYTTAIAACVKEPKRSATAVEWLKRMRSRRVQPNVLTYNTALASCLDGTLESTMRASRIATQMIEDLAAQVDGGVVDRDQYTDITPNLYTKTLARQLMKQLKTKWESGEIDKKVAKTTVRSPFLQLSAFERSEIADGVIKQKMFIMDSSKRDSEDLVSVTENDEADLEYEVAVSTHRVAAV